MSTFFERGKFHTTRSIRLADQGSEGRMERVSDLIDTTEMYLRTIYELEEEGVLPMRARIAERLGQSGPTVSQTVSRMQRDGLLGLAGDRHIVLTDAGRAIAVRVMRKHRLAECLLVEVIGLDWPAVHEEACRWEHVMSEAVERRIIEMLDHPRYSPYGNPIPGLEELGEPIDHDHDDAELVPSAAAAGRGKTVMRRLGEPIQSDAGLMSSLRDAGLVPGAEIVITAVEGGIALALPDQEPVHLRADDAQHILVSVG